MGTFTATELRELVDSPNETLGVEYKTWLDLADATVRADLARHVAAMANHGGGKIVLGISDDMASVGANPFVDTACHRDLIASIVKKHLEPPFQCDVHLVTSAGGTVHPVIVVPPHGSSPICAKAGGPQINGRQSGISQGTYYTRKAGPESAPILTAAEWAPIIRRCAMHERSAIIGALDLAIRGVSAPEPSAVDTLKTWHDAAYAAFLKDVPNQPNASMLGRSNFQYSYSIDRSDGQELGMDQLLRILDQVSNETKDVVDIGWSAFYPFTRPELAPTFQVDAAAGTGQSEFVECALLRDTSPRTRHADFWRVTGSGMATIVQDFFEDAPVMQQQMNLPSGTWLSPDILARGVAEVVRHARGFSERFAVPTSVTFYCEWRGLDGRVFADPMGRWPDRMVAKSDHRITFGTWPMGMLTTGWEEIVSELIGPVTRAFSTELILDANWVRGRKRTWRVFGS